MQIPVKYVSGKFELIAAKIKSDLARTKISNTIAAKQKNKPGNAGEAMLYTDPRVRESLRW